jgi:hypothetical protein
MDSINHRLKIFGHGRTLVAHICNPSYSEGRDQEDRGSKPGWRQPGQLVHKALSQKNPSQKRAGGVAKKKKKSAKQKEVKF